MRYGIYIYVVYDISRLRIKLKVMVSVSIGFTTTKPVIMGSRNMGDGSAIVNLLL
jgi:hypothetical protein